MKREQGSDMQSSARITGSGWEKLSSCKPFFTAALFIFIAGILVLGFYPRNSLALVSVAGIASVSIGVLILACKQVHRRGEEYRVGTLFHQEIIPSDDICMIVQSSLLGLPLRRIHLRKPTRFGWVVSYMPLLPKGNSREQEPTSIRS
ncbi:MAG: hypothetical protein ABS95_03180 [Verrucomicrobia bacterium SCN 57-15]|nr:MAG: hypothetical protein ABS95_03180 [Verrucomicrobia bacterium SCN 57-15]